MVTVPFFAEDGHGHPVQGITASDLSILDNKEPPQSVVEVRSAKDLPLRIGLLIDSSGSQGRTKLFRPAVQAASDLLYEVLNRADDKVFVATFTEEVSVSPFMTRDQYANYKEGMRTQGGTALYDAVVLACKRMDADVHEPARRVLVIESDGEDDASGSNRNQAIAAAQESGTVILAVSTAETGHVRVGEETLQQLADGTGGSAFIGLSPKDIPKVFSAIQERIEAMYAATYVPSSSSPGKYRSLELKPARDKELKLHAPKGYYPPRAR